MVALGNNSASSVLSPDRRAAAHPGLLPGKDRPPSGDPESASKDTVASSRSLRTAIRKVGRDGSSRKCPDLGCEFRDSLLPGGDWILRTGGRAAVGVTLSHQMLALAYALVRHSDLSWIGREQSGLCVSRCSAVEKREHARGFALPLIAVRSMRARAVRRCR